MYGAGLSQLLPLLAALLTRSLRVPTRRWVVVWSTLLAIQDSGALLLASRGISNLWIGHLGAPVNGAVALWMLSLWHPTSTGRTALRVTLPVFVAVSVALRVWVDDPTWFSLFAAPFDAMVVLLAAVWTFVALSLRATAFLPSFAWFWILPGLMVHVGIGTAIQAVIWYLYEAGRTDLIRATVDLWSGLDIVAFVVIAGGMLCRLPPMRSGGSSPPPSSRSASSWAGSPSP